MAAYELGDHSQGSLARARRSPCKALFFAAALRFSFVGTGTFQHPTRHGLIAVHDGPRKYILDLETGTAQLFDRATDPGELRDRAAEFPEDCARYRNAAEAVVARHDRTAT